MTSCFNWKHLAINKTFLWNWMQLLVFKRALGVEWYSRTVHLGVKWNGDMECNLVFKIINMLEWYSRTVPLGISNRNFWQVVSIENTWELTKHFYGMGFNFWSLKEQLMWNDIQKQFSWESVISDISSSIQLGIKEYIDINWFLFKDMKQESLMSCFFSIKSLGNQK